ncbi:hypothetical protein D3C78_1263880 [compost metagenome]
MSNETSSDRSNEESRVLSYEEFDEDSCDLSIDASRFALIEASALWLRVNSLSLKVRVEDWLASTEASSDADSVVLELEL